jgi:hypothetical protein
VLTLYLMLLGYTKSEAWSSEDILVDTGGARA